MKHDTIVDHVRFFAFKGGNYGQPDICKPLHSG